MWNARCTKAPGLLFIVCVNVQQTAFQSSAGHGTSPMQADVEACVEMFTPDKEEQLLAGNPAFVLDAIDNIDTKASLSRTIVPWSR